MLPWVVPLLSTLEAECSRQHFVFFERLSFPPFALGGLGPMLWDRCVRAGVRPHGNDIVGIILAMGGGEGSARAGR